jgi:YQGE family putative transporter
MLNDLSQNQRRLLLSFFLFALASPMVSVYTNTFLWRLDHDPITLGIFNIGMYAGISLGFLVNAYALRVWQSGKLYAFGCLAQGLIPVLLVSMGASAADYTLPLGLALGLAQGFYWANRNSITSKFTQDARRFRFISVETMLGIVAGIVSPLVIGWFIALGGTIPSYSVAQAYQLCAGIGLVLLIATGVLAHKFVIEPFVVNTPFVRHATARWNQQRAIEMLNSITSGLEVVIPLLVVLLFLGQEEAVGSVKALTGVLSAIMIYAIGKRVRHKHHLMLVGIWVAVNLLAGALFASVFTAASAIAYFIIAGITGSLRWSSFVTVLYEVVDREVKRDSEHRFLYILDREYCLNFGRVVGLLLFILAYHLAPDATIRYGLVMMFVVQLPVLWLLKRLMRTLAHSDEPVAVQEVGT